MKSVKTQNWNFWAIEYWFKAWECQIWLTNTKPFFLESETNLGTLQKVSPYTGVSYRFLLKSAKGLNRIFWVIEYWFKALECQIWSTNTKPLCWKSQAKLETLQKLSPFIAVSYKFVLKLVETLNPWIFWTMEYWFKALEMMKLYF